ncbi:trypco2 family protein, partial [Vibrio parahaemolyticus]
MKGNISLKEFIDDVKKELMEASESDSPFFTMDEVELEVSFGLNAKGKAGGKFVVFELGAETNASQMH